ncbi:MAG: DUF1566 domain-containing protein [Flavobacteriales bacterium]|nr:DUF1566 domain-containing protein [Flavobacteriales bacterium]
MKNYLVTGALLLSYSSLFSQIAYPIVDTDVSDYFDNSSVIPSPTTGQTFFGQDAHYTGNQPNYTNNGDGTITDNVTGLVWEQNMGTKINPTDAITKADTLTKGGFTDWRVPTLKELYSLILFTGESEGESAKYLYIDTNYFDQPIGDVTIGEREIDAQTWTSTEYVGLTMNGSETIFGVNFVDGRIKGYSKFMPPSSQNLNVMYYRMVRGNLNYGTNNFIDNNDGTVSDLNTGLMWQQADDGNFFDWENALSYCENLTFANYSDWRLPNPKELQSIIDYTRSPTTSNSAAIDPIFSCTMINDPDGNPGQYPYFWTSTTHINNPTNYYGTAAYFAFGMGQGMMEMPPNSGTFSLLDVHGAGSQKSDYKSGNPNNYPSFMGPQGDVHYVFNAVRAVRDISSATSINETQKLNKKLIKVVDVLGRETRLINNTTLFYIFDDGTVEKRIIIKQ